MIFLPKSYAEIDPFYYDEKIVEYGKKLDIAINAQKLFFVVENNTSCTKKLSENDKIVDCEIDMSTFSKYWKVKVRVSSFGPPIMYLSPFEYEKPIFNIVCDKDEIDSSSSTTCEVKVNSNYILNKVSFNLDIDRFNISNEEANEAFDLEKDDTSE